MDGHDLPSREVWPLRQEIPLATCTSYTKPTNKRAKTFSCLRSIFPGDSEYVELLFLSASEGSRLAEEIEAHVLLLLLGLGLGLGRLGGGGGGRGATLVSVRDVRIESASIEN